MEPLSALSLAATVVQLVDFTSKIVSKGYHLYEAADGALPQNKALEYIVVDLQNLNARLKHHEKLSCATKEEQALEDLSAKCTVIADELVSRLDKLKVAPDTKHRRWNSFRQALKSIWSKEELDDMAARLSEYRSQLEFHILLSLKEKSDLLAIELSDQFDRLDDLTKSIIQKLQQNQKPFTDELRIQSTVIAELHRGSRFHVSQEHERTRAEIIQAIDTHKNSHGAPNETMPTTLTGTTNDEKNHNIIANAILDSLRFPSIQDRYDAIDDAHKKTFDWIFCQPDSGTQPWSNFSDWLVQGKGIYWISGKAGSGKSTLMRYIYEDARTLSLLGQWAGSPENLTIAGFFFWRSGTEDQATQLGLLRSLLYKILYKHRKHIPTVFPHEWQSFNDWKASQSGFPISEPFQHRWMLKKLKAGLQRLFQINLGRLCLFIDGLDEYDGDCIDIIKLLNSVASTEIKICTSSRPWVEFQEAFRSQPSLRLHDLTFDDITLYVNENLASDEKMVALCHKNPTQAPYISRDIVTKANGVFLWVKLVTRSLLNGLTKGDSIADLDRRLQELPPDLEGLYTYLFRNIDSRYFMEASQIFQIMRRVSNWEQRKERYFSNFQLRLCALTLSFAIEDSEEKVISLPATPISNSEVINRVERMDKRLKVCCAGLLELAGNTSVGEINSQWRGITTPLFEEFGNMNLQYLHKTVRDFLESDQVLAKIQQATAATDFCVNSSLLKSFVLRLKICESRKRTPYDFEMVLLHPMEFAYTVQREKNRADVKLLDDLGRSFSRLRPVPADFWGLSDFTGKIMNYEGFNKCWPDDFLAAASTFSLSTYLAVKLAVSTVEPRCRGGHSYLFYATHGARTVVIFAEQTVNLLLKHSSRKDIKEAWKYWLQHIVEEVEDWKNPRGDYILVWINIFKLFLEYGADPGERVNANFGKRSVSDALDLISEKHPVAAAEVHRMLNRRHRFLYRVGLSRRKKTRDSQ